MHRGPSLLIVCHTNIGVGVVPFESIKGMMHKILEDTYIKVWYIGDLDVKIKLCKIKI